jgi:hypothetical protein
MAFCCPAACGSHPDHCRRRLGAGERPAPGLRPRVNDAADLYRHPSARWNRSRTPRRTVRGPERDPGREPDPQEALHLGRRPPALEGEGVRLLGRGELCPSCGWPAQQAPRLRSAGEELGRFRARSVDHRLCEQGPHLCGDRGIALRHIRGRRVAQPGTRPPMADDRSQRHRLRGPVLPRLLAEAARCLPGTLGTFSITRISINSR